MNSWPICGQWLHSLHQNVWNVSNHLFYFFTESPIVYLTILCACLLKAYSSLLKFGLLSAFLHLQTLIPYLISLSFPSFMGHRMQYMKSLAKFFLTYIPDFKNDFHISSNLPFMFDSQANIRFIYKDTSITFSGTDIGNKMINGVVF